MIVNVWGAICEQILGVMLSQSFHLVAMLDNIDSKYGPISSRIF